MFLNLFAICSLAVYGRIHSLKQPNIVLIVADDLGFNDVGFRGNNQMRTPNIDALAYSGSILDRFYTSESCTPSRAALITGNYAIRSGFQGYPPILGEERHLPQDMPTLPQHLKTLGYKTHLVGKWHLGYAYKNYTPIGRGFDTHYGFYNSYITYFSHEAADDAMSGVDFRDNFEPDFKDTGIYATDLFTKRSVTIIERHDYSREPLFLVISHAAPHSGKLLAKGFVLEEKDTENMNTEFGYINNENRRRFVDVVKTLDDSVGSIMKALSEKDILDKTYVMFLSDNGGDTYGSHGNYASNWPLRGGKISYHEGAIRTVAIFYSNHLTSRGKINTNLIHIADLLPTFYSIGGGNVSSLGKIDGIDQSSCLLLNSNTTREEILINIDESSNFSGIITHSGKYKLIRGLCFNETFDKYTGDSGRLLEDGEYRIEDVLQSDAHKAVTMRNSLKLTEANIRRIRTSASMKNCRKPSNFEGTCQSRLFNLEEDPCETTNIAESNEELVEKMQSRIEHFYQGLIPKQLKPADLRANPIYFGGIWTFWLET